MKYVLMPLLNAPMTAMYGAGSMSVLRTRWAFLAMSTAWDSASPSAALARTAQSA